MAQQFYRGIENLSAVLHDYGVKRFLLVCDSSFPFLNIRDKIEHLNIPFVKFDSFQPNPLHDDADKGRAILEENGLDFIVAVGGGSSMDVAKCIKLDSGRNITILASPTTAGTGSESTRHIVVYRDGKKESLGNPSVIPDMVLFEPKVLKTLPVFQKKCTLFDALCQGIESYWSVNANDESRPLSRKAIETIVRYMDEYVLRNDDLAAERIMEAANLAGQAINITQTTAAHAMSYKITSNYGIPHGGAVAICLPVVWETMVGCLGNDTGSDLYRQFVDIAAFFGCGSVSDALRWFNGKLAEYKMPYPIAQDYEMELEELAASVNPVRLKNNPVQFKHDELKEMYRSILR